RKSCTKHEKLFRTAHKDGESVSTGFIFDPRGTNKVEDKCEWEPYLDTQLPSDCCMNFNSSHDGSIAVCSFSEGRRTASKRGEVPPGSLQASRDGHSLEIGVDVMDPGICPDDDDQASVVDALLQIWTFKELITEAFGCGLRMDLNEISLSSLTNQSDIELDPIKTIEATRQKDFDQNWKFWNVVWTCPTQPGLVKPQSKYILLAAVRSFWPDISSLLR
ncbi:hypothetical protein PSHT_02862, partial [Puccinia striiformis]